MLSYSLKERSITFTFLLALGVKRTVRLYSIVAVTLLLGYLLWGLDCFYNKELTEKVIPNNWFAQYWKGAVNHTQFWQDFLLSPFSDGKYYNPPLWTIKYEFYGALMLFVVLFLVKKVPPKWHTAVFAVLLLAFYDSDYRGFWLGALLVSLPRNFEVVKKYKRELSFMLLGLAMFFACFPIFIPVESLKTTVYGWLPNSKWWKDFYPFLAASVFFLMVYTRRYNWLSNKVFNWLGKASYALYAVHFIVIASFSSGLFLKLKKYFSHDTAFCITFFCSMAVLFLITHILKKVVDQPTVKLSRRIFKKLV